VKPVNGKVWCRAARIAVLVVLASVMTTLRFRPHIPGHVPHRLGVNRSVLLSEPVSEGRMPLGVSVRTAACVAVPILAGAPVLLLRRRRAAFGSLPVGHRKLPPRSAQSPDPSD
jgi:hypothetical protein